MTNRDRHLGSRAALLRSVDAMVAGFSCDTCVVNFNACNCCPATVNAVADRRVVTL